MKCYSSFSVGELLLLSQLLHVDDKQCAACLK